MILATRPAAISAGEPGAAGAGIVGDDDQVARTLLDHRLAQRLGQSGAAEPGAQDDGTVLDPGHRLGQAAHPLIDHS